VAGRSRQVCGRHPHRRLRIAFSFAHRHARSVVQNSPPRDVGLADS
jgi:hypothetical protein